LVRYETHEWAEVAKWDYEMSKARSELDWDKQLNLALDPEKFGRIRRERRPGSSEVCTMCGEYCAIKLLKQYVRAEH